MEPEFFAAIVTIVGCGRTWNMSGNPKEFNKNEVLLNRVILLNYLKLAEV